MVQNCLMLCGWLVRGFASSTGGMPDSCVVTLLSDLDPSLPAEAPHLPALAKMWEPHE